MSAGLGKQNSSALKSETTALLTTKIDEDAIAPQEISKDDCDSTSSSDSNTDFEGIFDSYCFVIISPQIVFLLADLSILERKNFDATSFDVRTRGWILYYIETNTDVNFGKKKTEQK